MPDDIFKHLGNCIRKHRNKCGLTQQQLSDKAGVSVRHIAKIEKGIINPSFEKLHALVTALGVPPIDLFYSELPDEEREVGQLTGYYRACPHDDRVLIMKTVQCLTNELMGRSKTAEDDSEKTQSQRQV